MALPLSDYLPFWSRLTPDEQQSLAQNTTLHEIKKGTILHNGNEDCVGLLVVTKGQLRAFTRSAEGKEMTLYRLFERDICLFSASCILNSIVFDLSVSAEQDSTLYRIPSDLYRAMMQQSPAVANFTNELMAQRFSDVMWLFDQVMNKRMDSRLAALLTEESELAGREELKITHDELARHLGTAREVVTRMLKYLQAEGAVTLSRGGVRIADRKKLLQLAQESLR